MNGNRAGGGCPPNPIPEPPLTTGAVMTTFGFVKSKMCCEESSPWPAAMLAKTPDKTNVIVAAFITPF